MMWITLIPAAVLAGWILGHGDAASNFRQAESDAFPAAAVALLGVTLGLYGRDRVRLRRAYASPTLSFLGKRGALAAAALAATYALAPVAWPPDWFLGLAALFALGTAVWLGNLPSRL